MTALALLGAGSALGGCTPDAATAVDGSTGGTGNGASGSGGLGASGSGGLPGSGGSTTGGSAGTSTSGAGAGGASAGGGGGTTGDSGAGGVTGVGGTTGTGGSPLPDSGTGGTETVGIGDVSAPALGPAPLEAARVGGAPFVLVKNWDFGTNGTIKDVASLISEFQFHDQFGTIANGTNYGAVTVAPDAATAISASNLGLPGNMQPIEDPAHPTREWTADTLKAHVRPLSASQSTCTVSAHDAGNGSFTAKWKLPKGGALLGKDLLWETRVRMPVALTGYWFALWTAGNPWNKGAEMDVLESFGTPNIYPPAAAFHVNSVGGQDSIDYSSWPAGLTAAGVPANGRDLAQWHVFTWVYSKDDSYEVYFDGVVVQTGTIHWTLGGTAGGQVIDMDFLFDFSWGHTQIADVNIALPASAFPITYEIDYSRVYLR